MEPVGPVKPARPSRRNGRLIAAICVVAIVVLIIAADVAARAITKNVVEGRLRAALVLPSRTPIEVEVGGFSVLAQLVQGRLDRLEIAVPGVTVDGLTGDARVRAEGFPFDQEETVTDVLIEFRMNAEQLRVLSANLSGLPISSVEIADTDIRIVAEFEALGLAVPIGVGIEPRADSGRLTFTPTSVSVAGASISANELRQLFGAPGVLALRTQSFCIAQNLPVSLELTSARIDADELVMIVAGGGVPVSRVALDERGSCG